MYAAPRDERKAHMFPRFGPHFDHMMQSEIILKTSTSYRIIGANITARKAINVNFALFPFVL